MAIHHLTEAKQGTFQYTIGPYALPILTVDPGDSIVVETLDAFEGKIDSEQTKPSEVLAFSKVNPLNGPIYLNDTEKGDALKIRIDSIRPRGPQPRGTTCLIPFFGGLTGTRKSPTLQDPLPEIVRKVHVTTEHVVWNKQIKIPYEPFIGTIGTAPELDSVNSLTPDDHGGNMDLPDVRPGSTIYLPVRKPGAFLFLGDCHATQGDGELCGVATEFPTETTIQVDVIKNYLLEWPRIESQDYIMSVGSSRPMEDAVKIAFRDLISWMVDAYDFDLFDAYLLLTQVAKIRVGNMVDPNYTIGVSIEKRYIEK